MEGVDGGAGDVADAAPDAFKCCSDAAGLFLFYWTTRTEEVCAEAKDKDSLLNIGQGLSPE